MVELEAVEAELLEFRKGYKALRSAVEERFLGQREAVDLLLLSIFAGGHVLLEGAPGLGKTTLVHTVADALDLSFARIQFTPDLMPGDILGMRLIEEDEAGGRRFTFQRGPIFANLVLADEINRATPRTQSALLEAMQERQVTIYGESLALDEPFCVVATQNPIEMEGTYPLPEAQLDRFLTKVLVEAPELEGLVAILGATTGEGPGELDQVLGRERVNKMRRWVRSVPSSSDAARFAAACVLATDPNHDSAPPEVRTAVRYGASPRGGQALLLLGKARALLEGRLHVALEDLEAVARPALRHRLALSYEGEAEGILPDQLVDLAVRAARTASDSVAG